MASSWIMNLTKGHAPRCRLFCFTPAGRGASIYATWARLFPPEIAVCPVQLPGRENRLRESPCQAIPELLQKMVPEIEPLLDLPYAFFGHSMGSILGFELARALLKKGRPGPVHLFVSAHRAPHLKDRNPPIAHLPDAEFLQAVQDRYQGIPESMIEDPEMRAIITYTLRADFSAIEGYQYCDYNSVPVSCPVTVLGGLEDPEVTEEELSAWAEHSTAGVRMKVFPGDHFFIVSSRDDVIATLISELRALYLPQTVGR